MSNPWNGKAVLEVFWYCATNNKYPLDWYTYVAKLAPRIAALGFDGIWTPPPCKDYESGWSGYTPVDYYDIGQKDQNGGVGTLYGNQDTFLRMIAVAHANGLEVYPDIVLDHCGDGTVDGASPWPNVKTCIQPKAYGGSGQGRWQRNWLDFHFNPVHWHDNEDDWVHNYAGRDFCYQGRCSDSGHADSNCANRQNSRAWFVWFVQQTGVDGFRFDDVKGYPPEVVEDLLYNAMGDRLDYFCVGEYIQDSASWELDTWAEATHNRSGTFDYFLHDRLVDFVNANGFYDVGQLPNFQQQNRSKTVPFVNNHDNYNGHVGSWIDADNPRARLAYAFAITVDGSPQFFYADLFVNVPPYSDGTLADQIPSRPWVENLVWCHQKLAFKSGDYFVRYQGSQQLLILERGARAIVAINNDGSSWHDAWISTAFPPHTQLHDYSGSRPDQIWTNQDGWVQIAVPPRSYSIWGPVGVAGGFAPPVRRTVQQFEMDDNLGDKGGLGYGGRAVTDDYRSAGSIWPAKDSWVNVYIYSDTPQSIDFQAMGGPAQIIFANGPCGPSSPLTVSFDPKVEAYVLLQAKLSTPGSPPAKLYIKVDYQGPANLTVP